MENFKSIGIVTFIATILLTGCDRVFKLETQKKVWEIKIPPSEVLMIAGPSLAFPVLDSIRVIRNNASTPLKLLLMTSQIIPDSTALTELYARPLDLLIGTGHTLDTLKNGFNTLCILQFSEEQTHSTYPLQVPITRRHTYIFGLSDPPQIEVNVQLYFHRLGNSEIPDVQIISLE